MPLKKYLSIIIKIVIVFFSFYFIYHQLVENKSFEELDISVLIDTVKKNKVYLVGVILMMFLNWLVEALKWRYMISKIENIEEKFEDDKVHGPDVEDLFYMSLKVKIKRASRSHHTRLVWTASSWM